MTLCKRGFLRIYKRRIFPKDTKAKRKAEPLGPALCFIRMFFNFICASNDNCYKST